MGRAARNGNFAAASNRWSASDAPAERPRPSPGQALSRSLVALDQNSTIIAVIEMSHSSWLVAGSQHHERVHCVVILFGQVASSREWRLARQRDVRVLRRPDRFETALLKRTGKLHRRHRIIGKEHRAAEMHGTLLAISWSGGRG